jgi:hypothetical protein
MARYAEKTDVSCEKSQAEIRAIIGRYGATRYATLDEPGRAAIMFEVENRRIRFTLPLPDVADSEFDYDGRGSRRSIDARHRVWEQACRQRWRALALAIKAKLEAVESGIAEFEQEFMAYVVLPNGQTVGEFVGPQIESSYSSQAMPKMLPGIGETGREN